jgi:enoyl-CoA hydratase/carnithine racemase
MLARRIRERSLRSANLALARAVYDLTEGELWKKNSQMLDHAFATEDAREGSTAFVQKRPPRWGPLLSRVSPAFSVIRTVDQKVLLPDA